jgi:hypothetical protein
MKKLIGLTVLALGFSALPLALHAQDNGEDETMKTLPEEASETAKENAAFGLETADEARADGRAFGESRAEEARENRGDAGAAGGDIADEARADGRAFGESRAEEARGDAGQP